MIGLLFFGAIAVWGVIAIALGSKLPEWLGIKRHRTALGFVFALLVFVAPVADEIIAYPQMQMLCQQVNGLELAPGMDEQKANGRTVYSMGLSTTTALWPSSVKILRRDYAYVDAMTKEPILQGVWFEPLRGMLGVPDGSSGGQMTLLLGKCVSKPEVYDNQGVPSRYGHLKLTKVPTP